MFGRVIMKWLQQHARRIVSRSDFHAHRSLSNRGHHFFRFDQGRDAIRFAETFQSGIGKECCRHFARIQFGDARIQIAPEIDHPQIRPQLKHLRLAAKTCRTDDCAFGQLGNSTCHIAQKRIAGIFPWQQAADFHPVRQLGRHVFHGMHGKMNFASVQLLFDFLGEEPLATKRCQRTIADTITCGRDDNNLNGCIIQAIMGLDQSSFHFIGLPQCQRASAGTDPNARLSVHGLRCYLPSTRLTSIREALRVKILGIETSCDETAAAVVTGEGRILANVVHSQIDDHTPFAGVVPEIAARAHVEKLDSVIERALQVARTPLSEVDAIAATAGPGLIGGVMVGFTTAKALALSAAKPLVAVNHLEAHALTVRMTDQVSFPFLLLLVSGGHCQILLVRGVGEYDRLGATIDDAVGEAFDKTAKLLQLGFPGGPAVERKAMEGNPDRFSLPRPMMGRKELDFSFSGLKTAVRQAATARDGSLTSQDIADLCAGFQAAIGDVLCDRIGRAINRCRDNDVAPTAFVIAGGVAANQYLRARLAETAGMADLPFVAPPPALCTDNGAMVAWAGVERFRLGLTDSLGMAPRARWPLDENASPLPFAGVKS
jgi:N6-L-threonylcarbamoyladenine synthase